MKVAFVSTWGAQCGISTYTEELTEALLRPASGVEVVIFAPDELGGGMREGVPQVQVFPVWKRQNPTLAEQLERVWEQTKSDVVHFQHEAGLFRVPEAFIEALRRLRRHCKVFVTLHTVHHCGSWLHTGFYESVLDTADVVVVHTAEAAASLGALNPKAHIEVVPHGTRLRTGPVGNVMKGLEALQVPTALRGPVLDGKLNIGLVLGFQGPNKNPVGTVRTFAAAVATGKMRNSILVFSGEAADPVWFQQLNWSVCETGYENRFVLNPRFVSAADIPHAMAAVTWGFLNTDARGVLSASGSSHVYMAHGVPIAVANYPIYVDAIRAGCIPYEGADPEPSLSSINAMVALATSPSVRAAVIKTQSEYAIRTHWNVIAMRYADLYREACK